MKYLPGHSCMNKLDACKVFWKSVFEVLRIKVVVEHQRRIPASHSIRMEYIDENVFVIWVFLYGFERSHDEERRYEDGQ